ncbi:MAG: DUF4136 domain-containing protein [Proteobacteria bacterium]|jgi:hypothetical protein|nr:DUF4136 domain-containing protein [Methylibium sp.]MBY0367408.1 DUF4136 domain-containing protein [Burkholderiaceae bacterium]MCH8856090.1 DUF4136 domain-containing protein [Pseudomonadota bacterium]|mmetsp:Transcript_18070/g.43156  ORF Transcript_18070/g.43156 Transcript_18070/m.43156 type:complete len:208 (+) Transcript_18070:1575-2198(+)
MLNRRLILTAAVASAAALAGCAGPFTVSADVSSYGNWPADRKPGSYAFDRLPSQQHNDEASKREAMLEDAAKPALEKAGLKPAADAKTADLLITLGARITAYDPVPWDDPLWWRWRGRLVSPRYGYAPGWGGWGWRNDPLFDRRYDRAVAVLVRDRASGEALFETHASNEGITAGGEQMIGALFEAALAEFPKVEPKSRRVSVQVAR